MAATGPIRAAAAVSGCFKGSNRQMDITKETETPTC